ncbi:MAG: homoserine dehydrogenase [Nitrosomonadales bacterium]
MDKIKVGIIGFGTVGSGTYKVLTENFQEIKNKTGLSFQVNKIADLNKELVVEKIGNADLYTDNINEVIEYSDIVVELIGGTTIAREVVEKALTKKKHVVTANKALIALYGKDLFALAEKNNIALMYEAAVAGGIPIIKTIREGLVGNKISWVVGILNGTTNYILSEMKNNGLSFETALKQAQELGYAEADPTFDIEGIDAAHKITILASIVFGIPLNFSETFVEGIRSLDLADVSYAEELGYRIKLLGIAKNNNNKIEIRVHPTLIPSSRLIANVDGPMNAILVNGNMVGPTLYYGAGAGSEATASAVVADIVDIGRLIHQNVIPLIPNYGFQENSLTHKNIANISEITSGFYLRIPIRDSSGVLANITKFFASKNISIDAMTQKESKSSIDQKTDVLIVVKLAKESIIDEIIKDIQSKEFCLSKIIKIRLELLNK